MDFKAEVLEIISKIAKVPKKELEDDTDIFNSNIVTSLGLLEIISGLEKKFDIFIMPEELIHDNFATVGSIVLFVNKKINSRG